MIEVIHHKKNQHISIDGHAGFAQIGEDIVCAGVSTLVQTMVVSIETLTEDKNKIKYDMSPGKADIYYGNLSKESDALINSFFVGVKLIASAYPDFVHLTKL